MSNDNVNHPAHYNQGDIECIQAIEAMLGPEGFVAYCRGNAMKYLWRCLYKGKFTEDLQKAVWYLNRASHVDKTPTSEGKDPPPQERFVPVNSLSSCYHCFGEGYIKEMNLTTKIIREAQCRHCEGSGYVLGEQR